MASIKHKMSNGNNEKTKDTEVVNVVVLREFTLGEDREEREYRRILNLC